MSVHRGGRLFILGVGGSAGHASHAVNDFRKLCGFEAYAPTDNVSELTARINDDRLGDRIRRMAARLAPRPARWSPRLLRGRRRPDPVGLRQPGGGHGARSREGASFLPSWGVTADLPRRPPMPV